MVLVAQVASSLLTSGRPQDSLISIFDCPEQTQTSPIMIFSSRMVFPAFRVMVKGPPAAGVATLICHLASRDPLMESVWLFQEVVIYSFSSGSHHPHNFAVDFCCRTILLDMIAGSRILAVAKKEKQKNAAIKKMIFFRNKLTI